MNFKKFNFESKKKKEYYFLLNVIRIIKLVICIWLRKYNYLYVMFNYCIMIYNVYLYNVLKKEI